jgi:8-oxo-dGTP pyrophosphatase MutT (NUDIX family)
MKNQQTRTIRIAAALINDEQGRLLLVRKSGTQWFMQAGGKIEDGESALSALHRELREEIGLRLESGDAHYLGRFSAPATNEPDHVVEAEIYHICVSHTPAVNSEIEEAVWATVAQAEVMPLAPLTRDHILPLSRNFYRPCENATNFSEKSIFYSLRGRHKRDIEK